ncbi:hypothetical protein [Breoghania sp.]|uniref:hypothetical protein n=1 Tax=Breoghania sp. TaxID=2065378 RepID=UPI0029C9E6CC|nr:hypothetical protein [Breoghania sp.]
MNALLIFAALLTIALALVAWAGDGRERFWDALFGPPDDRPVNFAELSPPPSSDFFIAAPTEECAKVQPNIPGPVFAAPPGLLRQEVMRIVCREPMTERVAMDPDWLGDRFIQRVGWLRVPHFIQVRYIPLDTGHTALAVYACCLIPENSRGYNEARVRRLIGELEEVFATPSAA